jgi:hypothetical protein
MPHQIKDTITIPYVQRFMSIAWDLAAQVSHNPTRVPFGTEEDSAVVAVDPGNVKSLARKEHGNFGTD